ncbi:MAG TPA: SPASM domain-containing protein [Sumerlaeia bacterium]|nr:SPASM domain-containing protein [Sumerlaeia bacterium]
MTLICKEAWEEVCILATGDVVCSCVDANANYILGNIRENRIDDIFHGERYRDIRRTLLHSGHSSYCPALGCSCASKTEVAPDRAVEPPTRIKKIRLETISFCNLRCPECKVAEWRAEGGGGPDSRGLHWRFAQLSLEDIRPVILDTKDTLEQIWIYNYGEPFLDKNLLDVLRFLRKAAPGVWLYTHTNGNAIPEGWIETIIRDDLIDSISFSIDGASQETYGKYRIGGSFETAFHNLLEFKRLKRQYRDSKPDWRKDLPHIAWQYILFQWNDSPEELARAQKLADEHDLRIQWVLTDTPGKSERFTHDSVEYQRLQGIKHYSNELLALRREQAADRAYLARIRRFLRIRLPWFFVSRYRRYILGQKN